MCPRTFLTTLVYLSFDHVWKQLLAQKGKNGNQGQKLMSVTSSVDENFLFELN